MERISEEDLDEAVLKLSSADQVFVCGVRSSYAFANWFAFALDLVIGKTRLYHSNIDNILLRMSELSKNSVMVVFSFHRYIIETINIARLAKQQGLFIIAFIDSSPSQITEFSDIVLSIQLNIKSTLDATPIVFSLMNSIVSKITIQNYELFKNEWKNLILWKHKAYFRTTKSKIHL